MSDLERVDRDLIGGSVEYRAGPLCQPTVGKCPFGRLFAFIIEKDDLAILARILDLPVDDHRPPLPKIMIGGDPPLKRDLVLQAGGLTNHSLVAVAVVDCVGPRTEPG